MPKAADENVPAYSRFILSVAVTAGYSRTWSAAFSRPFLILGDNVFQKLPIMLAGVGIFHFSLDTWCSGLDGVRRRV